MIHSITTKTFFLLWAAGVSQSVLITQWPQYISRPPNGIAEINCYQNDTDYDYLYWYKQLRGQSFQLMVMVAAGSSTFEEDFESGFEAKRLNNNNKHWSLKIQSIQKKDEAVYFCAASQLCANYEAHFGAGTKLTVLEPNRDITSPTVKVFPPSLKECENQKEKEKRKKTIVCVAHGFYPDHVSIDWTLNGQKISSGVATDSAAKLETEKGTYRISSRLRVSDENWHDPGNEFNCTVSFYDGKTTVDTTASVKGVEAKGRSLSREKYLRVTQSAKLSYTVFIVKSFFYGAFVTFLVLKLQSSAGNHKS
ncbi:M1-specific T cell receptor beta chain-like [Cheilinus undulatus]|uniref:M1-specific T cell receptor beta chain-like n=1 Tax=Cheilinus undulatus TaxID=241271 RepID=UPI001BD4DE98|nr:M1-specific T cell receptor beta chain-like [Cheilinus undulatus]